MNLRSPLVATCFTFAMTIVSTMAVWPTPGLAQGLPQVVTLNSGVQFEGEVFAVSAVPAGGKKSVWNQADRRC